MSLDHRTCHLAATDCACFNLRKAARAVTRFYDIALRPTGLRATQFTILTAVRLHGPIAVGSLADALVMDRTTLTRDLGVLQEGGLVLIEEGDDRRRRHVSLSATGERTLARALPVWHGAQKRLRGTVGDQRFATLLKELDAVLDAVERS